MILLPGEEKLVASNGGKIILTNQRIEMNDTVWGRPNTVVIFLEEISSVEVRYTNSLALLVLAITGFVVSIYLSINKSDETNLFRTTLIAGVIFILFWWLSGQYIISITSNGGRSLKFGVDRMTNSAIEDFIYKVQAAKALRIKQLQKL